MTPPSRGARRCSGAGGGLPGCADRRGAGNRGAPKPGSRPLSPREALKTCLAGCISMVLLAGGDAGHAQRQTADEGTSVVSRHPVTVSGYCEKFARRYSADNALDYEERSAKAQKSSDVMIRIVNLFQPPDARFTSEYDCRFRARRQGDPTREISVGVFLTRTRQFAEYTKWTELQIVPVEYVVDETRDRAGFGVFKYLEDR